MTEQPGLRPGPPAQIVVYALLCVFAALFVASIPDRQIHGDDAWLGEQAYWMSRVGHVRSDLFRGFLDYDQEQMVYHKLFILAGAAAVRVFGWSLHSLKAVSLLFYCLFVLTSYFFFSRNAGLFRKRDFYLFSLMMISAPLIFRFAYVYRPEIMLMAVGFLSFCFLTSGLNSWRDGKPGQPLRRALGAGVFAGVGLLIHLNGWIFVAAGLVVLLVNRAGKPALVFAAAAVAVSALYFCDLASADNLARFRHQLASDLPIGDAPLWRRLVNVAYEPKRFFYSIREVFPSALLVLSLVFAWRVLVTKHRDILIYLLVLVVGLAVLSRPRPSYYMVLYMPYVGLVITAGLGQWRSLATVRRAALGAVLVAHFAFSAYYGAAMIRSAIDLPELNRRAAAYIPRGESVVAPAGFIFNQIANYRIQSLTFYDRCADLKGSKLDPAEFFNLARSYGNRYVIVDREFRSKIELTDARAGSEIAGYALSGDVDGMLIFRLSEADS